MYVTFPSSMWNWCISAMPSNQWLKLRSKHKRLFFALIILIYWVLKEPRWCSPASSDLKLSRSIPEEIAFDPGGDVTCNCSCDGLWGFICRTHQILNARQTMNISVVLVFILWPGLFPACGGNKSFRSEVLCTKYIESMIKMVTYQMCCCSDGSQKTCWSACDGLLSWRCFKSCPGDSLVSLY